MLAVIIEAGVPDAAADGTTRLRWQTGWHGQANERGNLIRGFDMDGSDICAARIRRVRSDESGEGVISTAIAVLIMALIGAAMWLVFSDVFDSASDDIRDEVGRIGDP